MTQNNRIDLTAPEFEGNQQAQDLIELRRRLAQVDEFIWSSKTFKHNPRLKGNLEALHLKIEQMERELAVHVRQGNSKHL